VISCDIGLPLLLLSGLVLSIVSARRTSKKRKLEAQLNPDSIRGLRVVDNQRAYLIGLVLFSASIVIHSVMDGGRIPSFLMKVFFVYVVGFNLVYLRRWNVAKRAADPDDPILQAYFRILRWEVAHVFVTLGILLLIYYCLKN
jgi:hypothetical protein